MGTKKLWVVGLLAGALVGCGGGDSDSNDDSGTSSGTTSGGGGLPNSCELFTEADTAQYGGLGEGSHTSSAIDLCIYTETIDDKILQISVAIGPDEGYAPGVTTLDALYESHTETMKTPMNYGEESLMYVRPDTSGGLNPNSRGDLIILQAPYYLQVSTRLDDSATALQNIADTMLSRL